MPTPIGSAPLLVIVVELEAKPKIFTVGDGVRICDWVDGCADPRVRQLVSSAVALVTQSADEPQ